MGIKWGQSKIKGIKNKGLNGVRVQTLTPFNRI
jgi:hypothetical protein